jgi:hypothetical protein
MPRADHAWLLERLTVDAEGRALVGGWQAGTFYDRFMGGDSVATVADLYGVTIENVEDALRIEFALRRGQSWALRWVAAGKARAARRTP